MADDFTERYRDLLTGWYDCVDRIVLNACYPMGSTAGGFRTWWRRLIGGSDAEADAVLDNTHLMRLAGRFARRVRAWAADNAVPVIDCTAGERKHLIAEEYLRAHSVGPGVFMILVARAPAMVWDVRRSADGTVIGGLGRKRTYVNHYSFHIMDRQWGHLVIKMAGHAPFAAQVILNGHYAEQPAMPHEAETRPVTLGSRMLETAYLCRLRRHDLVACPSLWVSVSHIDGTGEIMTSEVTRIGGLRPPAEVTGPLAEHAAAFKQMLIGQGYARGTISAHLGLMSRVSRWLDVQGLPARALADLAEVDRFFAERRATGCRLRITARSLVPLLDFLRDRQVIGAPVVPAATPAEVLLAEYRTYLEQERAATAGTVVNFTKYAGIFLRTFPRPGSDAAQQADLAAALGRLTAAEVVTFVTGWASCRSPAYGQAMVYALRNLLRYLHARGLLSRALAEAVPTVPGWKPARPVRAVTGQQMAALLACCDRHSAIGRRDYAIMLLLTRLGLRASEVAGITLADIDWRQGVLRVRGKGNILAELPLPAVISSLN